MTSFGFAPKFEDGNSKSGNNSAVGSSPTLRRVVDHRKLELQQAPRIMLEANDSAVDDLLDMAVACGIEMVTAPEERLAQANELKAHIASEDPYLKIGLKLSSPQELRTIARSLETMADEAELGRQSGQQSSNYPEVFSDLFIARSRELAVRARRILDNRQMRDKRFPLEMFGEPAWDMLLELFGQFAEGKLISTKSLSFVSRAPATTALRYIGELERLGYVERQACASDKRVTLVSLSVKGTIEVGRVLTAWDI